MKVPSSQATVLKVSGDSERSRSNVSAFDLSKICRPCLVELNA